MMGKKKKTSKLETGSSFMKALEDEMKGQQQDWQKQYKVYYQENNKEFYLPQSTKENFKSSYRNEKEQKKKYKDHYYRMQQWDPKAMEEMLKGHYKPEVIKKTLFAWEPEVLDFWEKLGGKFPRFITRVDIFQTNADGKVHLYLKHRNFEEIEYMQVKSFGINQEITLEELETAIMELIITGISLRTRSNEYIKSIAVA